MVNSNWLYKKSSKRMFLHKCRWRKRRMNFLEERIQKDGIVREGNVLKVDSFLNHQMDIDLLDKIGEEFYKRFGFVRK